MPVPPPDPPNPLLGPPEGAKAKDPAPPLPGTPTLEPGWFETTTPVSEPTPPLLGGAAMSPTSRDPPKPAPRFPRPWPEREPPIEPGGGGTTPTNEPRSRHLPDEYRPCPRLVAPEA